MPEYGGFDGYREFEESSSKCGQGPSDNDLQASVYEKFKPHIDVLNRENWMRKPVEEPDDLEELTTSAVLVGMAKSYGLEAVKIERGSSEDKYIRQKVRGTTFFNTIERLNTKEFLDSLSPEERKALDDRASAAKKMMAEKFGPSEKPVESKKHDNRITGIEPLFYITNSESGRTVTYCRTSSRDTTLSLFSYWNSPDFKEAELLEEPNYISDPLVEFAQIPTDEEAYGLFLESAAGLICWVKKGEEADESDSEGLIALLEL